MHFRGTRITQGGARGRMLVCGVLSFYGGVDPDSGLIVQADHPRRGESVKGRILVMPRSTGSTVGSWTLLRMARQGTAPAAIVTETADDVLVTGTLLGCIPHLDGIRIPEEFDGVDAWIAVDGEEVSWGENADGEDPEPRKNPIMEIPKGVPALFSPESPCVVKLGGSLVTFKDSPVPRVDFGQLESMCRLLALHARGPLVLVHGAGSFGHGPVSRLRVLERPLDDKSRLDWSSVVSLQFRLNDHVCSALTSAGIPAFPLQAAALGYMEEGAFRIPSVEVVRMVLEQGFVPVLYGTPCLDMSGRPAIASGDDLVCALALTLGFPRIVHLTAAAGVHAHDPVKRPDSPVIPFLTPGSVLPGLLEKSPDPSVTDVTGSMAGKLRKLIAVAEKGVVSWIVDGRDPVAVGLALSGIPAGTVVQNCVQNCV